MNLGKEPMAILHRKNRTHTFKEQIGGARGRSRGWRWAKRVMGVKKYQLLVIKINASGGLDSDYR